jgi:hypothetical protein
MRKLQRGRKLKAPLRSTLLSPFAAARAFQSRGAGVSALQLNRPALSGARRGSLSATKGSTAGALLQNKCCLAGAAGVLFAGPALKRSAGLRVGGGVGRGAAHAASSGASWLQASVGIGRRLSAQSAVPSATLGPNPSIERTASGKPEAAAHVER